MTILSVVRLTYTSSVFPSESVLVLCVSSHVYLLPLLPQHIQGTATFPAHHTPWTVTHVGFSHPFPSTLCMHCSTPFVSVQHGPTVHSIPLPYSLTFPVLHSRTECSQLIKQGHHARNPAVTPISSRSGWHLRVSDGDERSLHQAEMEGPFC